MNNKILAATDQALRQVGESRFWRTERGFHGRFYCALQKVLDEEGLLPSGHILEMEYQKSARHGISQRPDIVLHMPVEKSGASETEHNFAVWALKRQATPEEAKEDFDKLDEMFQRLCYLLGVFVNIDPKGHAVFPYCGKFSDRLYMAAAWLEGMAVETFWR